jgi:hypothetical protein
VISSLPAPDGCTCCWWAWASIVAIETQAEGGNSANSTRIYEIAWRPANRHRIGSNYPNHPPESGRNSEVPFPVRPPADVFFFSLPVSMFPFSIQFQRPLISKRKQSLHDQIKLFSIPRPTWSEQTNTDQNIMLQSRWEGSGLLYVQQPESTTFGRKARSYN